MSRAIGRQTTDPKNQSSECKSATYNRPRHEFRVCKSTRCLYLCTKSDPEILGTECANFEGSHWAGNVPSVSETIPLLGHQRLGVEIMQVGSQFLQKACHSGAKSCLATCLLLAAQPIIASARQHCNFLISFHAASSTDGQVKGLEAVRVAKFEQEGFA